MKETATSMFVKSKTAVTSVRDRTIGSLMSGIHTEGSFILSCMIGSKGLGRFQWTVTILIRGS
jgi:hypothetical protein